MGTDDGAFLRTPRLLLSRPQAADAEAVFALLSDQRTLVHNPSDRMASLDETVELVVAGAATGCSTASATAAFAASPGPSFSATAA